MIACGRGQGFSAAGGGGTISEEMHIAEPVLGAADAAEAIRPPPPPLIYFCRDTRELVVAGHTGAHARSLLLPAARLRP